MPEDDIAEMNRALAEFTKIPGVGLSKAKKLYESGYKTLDDLKNAPFEELANIKGIGESRATLIKKYFEEGEEEKLKKETAVEQQVDATAKKSEVENEKRSAKLEMKESETEREIKEMEKELEEAEKVLETAKGRETKIVIEKKVAPKEGKINGLKAKPMKQKKPVKGFTARRIGAAFLVLALIFSSIFVLWYAFQPVGRIKVDGSIDDWEGIARYTDTQPVFNMDINLNEYSVYYESDRVYFYAKVSGSLFNGANNGYDALIIFVDTDANANTGYRIENLGADAKIEVSGYAGEIRSAVASRFIEQSASSKPELNYSAWENAGEVRVEKSTNIVEGYAKIAGLNNPVSLVLMRHYESSVYAEKRGMALVSKTEGSLVVYQNFIGNDVVNSDEDVLELRLIAKGKAVHVESLSVENANLDLPKKDLGVNEELTVRCKAKSLSDGIAYTFAVSSVDTNVPYRIVGNGGKAYFGSLPSGIVIDGAFGDWQGVQKGFDVPGDAGKNIDLREYASAITNNAYFYMAVDGTMLAGCEIPVLGARPPVQPGPPTPVVIKENLGMDVARVYIDLMNSTINTFNPAMISHGYLIELQGRNGQVVSAKAWKWENGVKAEEIQNPNIVHGLSDGKIEFSVGLDTLPGTDGNSKFYFEMTNWLGEKDANELAYCTITQETTKWWHQQENALFMESGGRTSSSLAGGDIRCIAAGDINRDGYPDIVSGDAGNYVYVWMNPGKATVWSPNSWTRYTVTSTALPDYVTGLALGDLDNDGDLDIAACCRSNGNNNVRIYRNDANGTSWYERVVNPTTTLNRPTDIEVGDFDGDGWLDLVTCVSNNQEHVRIWQNDRTPFDSEWASNDITGDYNQQFMTLDVADLDMDGNLDIIVSGNENIIRGLKNPGRAVAFTTSPWPVIDALTTMTANDIRALETADFDNDGCIDIVTLEGNAMVCSLDVWRNPGFALAFDTGSTWKRTQISDVAGSEETGYIEMDYLWTADFDNDGWIDILGGNSSDGSPPSNVFIWENTHEPFTSNGWVLAFASNTYSNGVTDATTLTVNAVVAADFDRDGDLDIACGDASADAPIIWNNSLVHRNFEFVSGGSIAGSEFTGNVTAMASGDLDNDGDLDVVVGDNYGRVWAYNNSGNSSNSPWDQWTSYAIITDLQDSILSIAIGDLDRDGKQDVVIAEALGFDDSIIVIYRNVDPFVTGGWRNETVLDKWATGTNAPVDVVDIDKDGDLDVVSGDDHGNIGLFNNDGTPFDGGWSTWINIFSGGSKMNAIALGDLDRDGDVDVCSGDTSGGLRIHRCPADPFSGTWDFSLIATISEISAIKCKDYDIDGDLDIVTGDKGTTYQIKLWGNPNSSGRDPFVYPWLDYPDVSIGSAVLSMDAGDLDNDGDVDIVCGCVGGNVTAVKNPLTEGTLGILISFIGNVSGNVTAIVLANLDPKSNDTRLPADLGDLDLITGNQKTTNLQPLRTWRNIGANCRINATSTAPESLLPGQVEDLLAIRVVHNGISADNPIKIKSWHFLFHDQNLNPLQDDYIKTLFDNFQIYYETGVVNGWDSTDVPLSQISGSPAITTGIVSITIEDVEPNATIPARGMSVFYLVVNRSLELAPPGVTHFIVRFDPDGYAPDLWNSINQTQKLNQSGATVMETDQVETSKISVNEIAVFSSNILIVSPLLLLVLLFKMQRNRRNKFNTL
ncbi:MAG: FG-GAP-like repeat-containing protein [Thermoplasmata archaeon]